MNLAIELFYPFDSSFMVRALVAAIVVGFSAPLIGTFIVQRKLSLVGDGLGHVAAAGVGLALWLDLAPQPVAIVATVIAAIAIEWIFHTSKSSDTALAIIFYSGIAASITFAGRSSDQGKLQQYLFGSILSITWQDVIYLVLISSIASLIVVLLSKLLLSIAIDESSAKIAGINTHVLHVALMSCIALVVSMSMSITGLLLISAIMVIPVMAAQQLSNSFYQAWMLSCFLGVLGSIVGLSASRMFDLAPGGSIVLTHVILFALTSAFEFLKNKRANKTHVHQHTN